MVSILTVTNTKQTNKRTKLKHSRQHVTTHTNYTTDAGWDKQNSAMLGESTWREVTQAGEQSYGTKERLFEHPVLSQM